MQEEKGKRLICPMFIAVVVLAVICIGSEVIMLLKLMPYYFDDYTVGSELFICIMYNVIGILVPVVVLLSVLANNRSVALFLLSLRYVSYIFIEVFYRLIHVDSKFIAVYVIMAVFLFLVAIKKVKATVALIFCVILEVLFVIMLLLEFKSSQGFGLSFGEFYYFAFSKSFLFGIIYLLAIPALSISLLRMVVAEEEKLSKETANNKQDAYWEQDLSSYPYSTRTISFEEKNIAVCIILSIVTFGIYGIVWLVDIVRNVHKLHNNEESVVKEVLLMLLVPFYVCYWMHKNGKQMYEDSNRLGGNMSDNSIVYLVLSLFGGILIDYALIQNDFNNFSIKKVDIAERNEYQSGELNPTVGGQSHYSSADEIKKYKELLDMGAITQEEFDVKKRQLLDI